MWSSFALACIACAIFIFLPGYVLVRAGRIGRIAALCLGPLVSVFIYEVLGIVYNAVGIFSTWVNVFFVALAIAVVAYAVSLYVFKPKHCVTFGFAGASSKHLTSKNIPFDWVCLVAYAVVGCAVGILFCLSFYNTPDAYPEAYDLVHHAGSINAYILSGDWSTLHSWLYYGDNASTAPVQADGFYPSAYYTLCAMAVSISGISATAAMNVVNMLCICLVFPVGIYAFVGCVFREKPWAHAIGCLLTLVVCGFPWSLFTWGPLFPNLASLSFLPAFAACFVVFAQLDIDRATRLSALIIGCVGLISMAFLQPNGVFSAYVLLVPYYVCQVAHAVAAWARSHGHAGAKAKGLGAAAGFVFACLCVFVWLALYNLPMLQGVVSYTWQPFATQSEAFFDILTMKLRSFGWQPVCAVLVLIGVLYTFKERKYLWLTCAYVLAGIIYVADISTSDFIQHVLSGFWYTDSVRVAAMVCVFAIPLACLGAWVIGHAFYKLTTVIEVHSYSALAKGSRGVGVVVLVAAVAFGGWWFFNEGCARENVGEEGNALAYYITNAQGCFRAASHRYYNETERDFIEQVKQAVPEGALIVNEPNDGSAFAAAIDPDINLYYRYMRGYNVSNETSESVLIRTHLNLVATDEEVANAVRSVGAEYVLELDYNKHTVVEDRMWSYKEGGQWSGIDGVQDDTPGFEVVLEYGDMRLFRITALD